jgi:hypothetical protein
MTLKRFVALPCALLCLVLIGAGSAVVFADTTDSHTYGSGNYGRCEYGSCTLTLMSGSSTAVDVLPSGGGACTVASDTVSVLTSNDTGYTLTMNTTTTDNTMSGPESIAASSGTAASPVTLAMNTWGYRVDGLSGFGTGPTSAQSSSTVPGVTFAGVPASDQTATPVASSNTVANPAVETTVWYGLCADSSIESGTYTVDVTYTAITN